MSRLWILFLLIYAQTAQAAQEKDQAKFFFGESHKLGLYCNKSKAPVVASDQSYICQFKENKLVITLKRNNKDTDDGWQKIVDNDDIDRTAILDSKDKTIEGDCEGSVKPNAEIGNGFEIFDLDLHCVGKVLPPPDGSVKFRFGGVDDPSKCNIKKTESECPLTCNGEAAGYAGLDVYWCPGSDDLVISRKSWGWNGEATFSETISSEDPYNITGFCAGSVRSKNNEGAYPLETDCKSNNTPPPAAKGEKLIVDEWFTDLPWHQKLSTLDSNLIDVPFVLPYQALGSETQQLDDCKNVSIARCMLRYGIVNVIAVKRNDTMYEEGKALTPEECKDNDCVEVKLDIYRYHTNTENKPNSNGVAFAADPVSNNPYTYNNGEKQKIPSLGFAVTEATIFAPWRPWYTSHYCAYLSESIQDAVCYDDYFTTQLIAGTPPEWNWIKNRPVLFWPRGTGDFQSFCQSIDEGNADNSCTVYLGKVAWDNRGSKAKESKVVACDVPDVPVSTIGECQALVNENTASLDEQFNTAIPDFIDQDRYPWDESEIDFVHDLANKENNFMSTNPFIGFYELERSEVNKDNGVFRFTAPHFALPKKCTQADYWNARTSKEAKEHSDAIKRLEDCALNYEIHTSGFHEQWYNLYPKNELPLPPVKSYIAVKEISAVFAEALNANQYGRTMFMYAGVPEQHIAVSFEMLKTRPKDGVEREMSIYDRVYNASLYTQYLPMVNPADLSLTNVNKKTGVREASGKNYSDNFWHAFFMSNHMNQTPGHFIRGIRGRTLWHNEYRSNLMYDAVIEKNGDPARAAGTPFEDALKPIDFAAGFQVVSEDTNKPLNLAPFHGNTCDSCHIRNGSGVPLMPNGKLPQIHVNRGMADQEYTINHDYTYTNPELPSLKMVFFDLKDTEAGDPEKEYYKNKIMNFYGNSFHVNQKLEGGSLLPTYNMKYVEIGGDDGFEIVAEPDGRPDFYKPKRVEITPDSIATGSVCKVLVEKKDDPNWPQNCGEVDGTAIQMAINGQEATGGNEAKKPEIGFMHLMGRRLGNTPMIEMIPDKTIFATQELQATLPKGTQAAKMPPGTIIYAPGTRIGTGEVTDKGSYNYRNCPTGKPVTGEDDCYISRWGWIGDRASLEDQVANAAHVEMNITSTESYNIVNPGKPHKELVRYDETLCGPADKTCQDKEIPGNSDITEQEIRDMATYQRWIGIPNRSEYQVSTKEVQRGEEIFRELHCDSCHVIDKIVFDADDNMLPDEERKILSKLQSDDVPDYPFISYLGTDLMMHDMGYLSQVARAPVDPDNPSKYLDIRNEDGTVDNDFKTYVQKIRTPALKGLRFNRFVTDSNHNTTATTNNETGDRLPLQNNFFPGCDFLLHDGRACDAIEAAFLHDGPAIKALGTIEALKRLLKKVKKVDHDNLVKDKDDKHKVPLDDLRAFLYSL